MSVKEKPFNTTILFYPKNNPNLRLFALWYFTILMIVWNVLGHTVLGFEQSWATPITAVLVAMGVSMLLDWIDACVNDRALRFTGSLGDFLNFLPACLYLLLRFFFLTGKIVEPGRTAFLNFRALRLLTAQTLVSVSTSSIHPILAWARRCCCFRMWGSRPPIILLRTSQAFGIGQCR